MLEVGERIVLGDVGIDWPERRRLFLTNRRLVLFQGKGLLRRYYVKAREYSIGQIEEAYVAERGGGDSWTDYHLAIRMKGGEERECTFSSKRYELRTNIEWANAINGLIDNRSDHTLRRYSEGRRGWVWRQFRAGSLPKIQRKNLSEA